MGSLWEIFDNLPLWSIILLGGYVLWLLGTAFESLRAGTESTGDFYLAGRSVGRWPSLLTFFASFVSAGAVVGGVGYFYTHGIGTFFHGAITYLLVGIVCVVVGKRLWKRSRRSPTYESPIRLIFEPFDVPVAEWTAVVITLIFLVPYLALQIVALARIVNSSFGWSYNASAVLSLAVIYVYSESGGLKDVIKSDNFQSCAALISVIVVAVYFMVANWGWNPAVMLDAVAASSHEELLSLPGPRGFYTLPIVAGLGVMFGLIALTQPHMVKRYIITERKRDLWVMAIGIMGMGFVLFLATSVIGLGGSLEFPGAASGDAVVGKVLASVPGFVGAFALLGIASVTMSTGDSLLLVFGLLVADEIAPGEGRDERRMQIGHWFAVGVAVLALIASIQPPELVLDLAIVSFGGTLQLAPAFAAGVFGWRCSDWGLSLSMISGVVALAICQWFYPGILPESIHPAIAGFAIAAFIVGVDVLYLRAKD